MLFGVRNLSNVSESLYRDRSIDYFKGVIAWSRKGKRKIAWKLLCTRRSQDNRVARSNGGRSSYN